MKKLIQLTVISCLLLTVFSCGTRKSMQHQPQLFGYNNSVPTVTKQSPTVFYSGSNSLLKNKQGLWELYVEGDPLERGLEMGSLTDSLLKKQEQIFFSKINDLVPSKFRQKVLRSFLKWYNRKLYLNVPEEYQTEIYGVSRYNSQNYDHIAPQYLRSLYLHAAHDIGHVLQDLNMVACSSFAAWNDKSEDGSLILGRNLDFYAGDDFSKDKIVAFVNPDEGYPFMMVTWAGMVGALSGMNNEGLTITINSGKSKIPWSAKTPITLLSREILQYAKNIDEAIAIAKKREVFVSESIMIGSAFDKRAVLIEVAPHKIGVFDVPNSNQLLCSNHFQSAALKDDNRNEDQIKNSHSKYRYDRMVQLFDQNPKINPKEAVAILRNKDGLDNLSLGYGNEKALNQLLAHHGVVFKPEQRLVWVSANPYQMGEFVCYDLNKVFKPRSPSAPVVSFQSENLNIAKDPFLETVAYKNYEEYRIADRKIDALLENKEVIPADFAQKYQSLNPDFWAVYYKVGLSQYQHKEYKAARANFEKALTKEITLLPEKESIQKYLRKIKRKL